MADIIRKKQAKEGLRFPDSAIEALDKWVMDSINKAAKRATANGRKTIQEHDF
jgi:histone H3/H4